MPAPVLPWMDRTQHGGYVAWTSLLAANGAVFGWWQVGNKRVMHENFLCGRLQLRHGRWHTLLTSCISHQRPVHFVFNSCGLWTIGWVAAEKLSNTELAGLCTFCGISSAAGHVLLHREPVLGASGMLMGLLFAGSALQPERRFSMIPFPMTFSLSELADTVLLCNLLGWALKRFRPFASVAWASHVAGAAAGLAVASAARAAGDQRFQRPKWIGERP